MSKYLKKYYPDFILQAGIFLLAVHFYQTCSRPFIGGECLSSEIDMSVVVPIMLVSLAANIFVRRVKI